jgi:hypothetical protein
MRTVQLQSADSAVIGEAFAALVYAEEDLLRAEFDALTAATWDQLDRPRPARGADPSLGRGRRPGRRHDRHRCGTWCEPVEIRAWARERSPPDTDFVHATTR